MTSPICEVKDGAGAYASTTDGVDVTPTNTVTIRLASQAGVDSWSISCVYTDDTSDADAINAALVVDPITKTATFTAPAVGKALIFQSRVNGGVDVNGRSQASYTATFGIFTLTAEGRRVLAMNETLESNADFGWIVDVNALIRNPSGGGGGATPAGTDGDVQTKNGAALAAGYARHASNLIQASKPRVGLNEPYASEGRATQAMADANQTAAASVYSRRTIQTTGALTADRTLTLPAVASADGVYYKIIQNDCTGFDLIVSTGGAATVRVKPNTTTEVMCTTGGVRRVSSSPDGTSDGQVQIVDSSLGFGYGFRPGYAKHVSDFIWLSKPRIGDGAVYASEGGIGINIADANLTLTNAQYIYSALLFSSTPATTAIRTITLPAPPNAASNYWKFVSNGCAHAITLTIGSGSTLSITSGHSAWVRVQTDGIFHAGGPILGSAGSIPLADGSGGITPTAVLPVARGGTNSSAGLNGFGLAFATTGGGSIITDSLVKIDNITTGEFQCGRQFNYQATTEAKATGNAKGTEGNLPPVHVTTADATPTTLDTYGMSTNSRCVTLTWLVTGIKSDGSQGAGYQVSAVALRNSAGTVSIIASSVSVIGESNSAWDCSVTTSGTSIVLNVTGVAATSITWTAIRTRLEVQP
jgi:hypothetical protein